MYIVQVGIKYHFSIVKQVLHGLYVFLFSIGKVNIPNLPPGVAGLMPPQYMIGNPSLPAAFYGLHQTPQQQQQQQAAAAAAAATMYSTYNAAAGATTAATGLEDLAALQRGAAAGLHTLVGATAGQQQQSNTSSQAGSTSQHQPQVPQPGSAKTSGGSVVGGKLSSRIRTPALGCFFVRYHPSEDKQLT